MSSSNAKQILNELRLVVRRFNEYGLSNQGFDPLFLDSNIGKHICSPNRVNSNVLRNVSYEELYDSLLFDERFLIRLIDGALLQFDYQFDKRGKDLITHRLAFLPSPRLDPFLEIEQDYWEGSSFAEMVGHQVMPVPIRIDYDNRTGVRQSVSHPAAHMTLGQYNHCRIPLSSPMRPATFASFIGTHFYSDSSGTYGGFQSGSFDKFGESMDEAENLTTHIRVAAR